MSPCIWWGMSAAGLILIAVPILRRIGGAIIDDVLSSNDPEDSK